MNTDLAPAVSLNPSVKSSPVVGDVLVSTWGYDQTNADFYKVTKVYPSGNVELIGLRGEEVSTGWAHGNKTPTTIAYGKAFRRKALIIAGDNYWVSINSFSGARPWNGKPVNVSHTH